MKNSQLDGCRKLVLPFLDERNYLQGTTLFDALWPLADYPRSFFFRIRKKIFSNCIFISANPANASGELIYPDGAIYIKEAPRQLPISRGTLDEKKLLVDFEYLSAGGFKIQVKNNDLLQAAVAGFKHFLLRNFPKPDEDEHWAFVGLRTKNWPKLYNGFLEVDQLYCNAGRARCVVNLEKAEKAELYFSLASRNLPNNVN